MSASRDLVETPTFSGQPLRSLHILHSIHKTILVTVTVIFIEPSKQQTLLAGPPTLRSDLKDPQKWPQLNPLLKDMKMSSFDLIGHHGLLVQIQKPGPSIAVTLPKLFLGFEMLKVVSV